MKTVKRYLSKSMFVNVHYNTETYVNEFRAVIWLKTAPGQQKKVTYKITKASCDRINRLVSSHHFEKENSPISRMNVNLDPYLVYIVLDSKIKFFYDED